VNAAELPTSTAEQTFMGMPQAVEPVYWTADMVRALPDDGNRYEVVYGELLVTPSPRAWHQILVARMAVLLEGYLRKHRVGTLLISPADISWGADVLVQPDVFVVPLEQARTLQWDRMRDLLLVVEVVSPSTARHDRFTKRRRYQEAGVPVYWIVDGDRRQVEVWAPGDVFPIVEATRLGWHPAGAARPLVIELSELFRAV
jgi:Uma2 family endonuclease